MTLSHKKKKSDSTVSKPSVPEDIVYWNPQRKRLQQLHDRRQKIENAKKLKKEKENSKISNLAKESSVSKTVLEKASAEHAGTEEGPDEYSAEEADEEAYKGVKNETLRVLLIEVKKLKIALKTIQDEEKKLKSLSEAANKWFSKYDDIINGVEEQMNSYDSSRDIVALKIMQDVKPLYVKWAENQEKIKALMKYRGEGLLSSNIQLFKNLAHYGISFIRSMLYAIAYCRDKMFSAKDIDPSIVKIPEFISPTFS